MSQSRDATFARTGGIAVALVLALAACSQTASLMPSGADKAPAEADNQPSFAQFPDIPVPRRARMNVDKTLVFGSDTWFGQLTIDTTHDANAMFDFYKQQLPNYRWREITSVRAPTSVLTYDQGSRVLAIQIRNSTLGGAEVVITVSPRGSAATPAAGPAYGRTGSVLPAPVQPAN